MQISVTDVNDDEASYALTGGADAALFAIDALAGALAFATAPDFDIPADFDDRGVYNMTVAASDGTLGSNPVLPVTVTGGAQARADLVIAGTPRDYFVAHLIDGQMMVLSHIDADRGIGILVSVLQE